MSFIDIFLLDNSNNTIEAISIDRPDTYQGLITALKNNLHNLPNSYTIYFPLANDIEFIIDSDEKYSKSQDILFVRQINKSHSSLNQSLFTKNFNKLTQVKKDKIVQKYTCSICSEIIKKDTPLFCYLCQKMYHSECLKGWAEVRKQQSRNLNCPNCRKELPLENWKPKLDFDEIRKNDAEIMDLLNQREEEGSDYKDYISNTVEIFKKVLTKINEIHLLLSPEESDRIINLIKELTFNVINPPLDDISIVIFEELEMIDNYLKKYEIKEKKEEKLDNNSFVNIDKAIEYRKEINIIYYVDEDKKENILGEDFINNNKNNVQLMINSQKVSLTDTYDLKRGENKITIIINNKLTNLSYMFQNCHSLQNIDELKYLDTSEVTNYENMFHYCNSLSDIRSLQYWNVSKGTNFKGMFSNCKSLYDISPLQNWNVSNATNMAEMFSFCRSLANLAPLQLWNVSNNNNFDFMFYATLVKDIKPLENWSVSNGHNFSGMFCSCSSLRDLKPLEKWDVSNVTNFQGMFSNCKLLEDIGPLKGWNVSKGNNFTGMFFCCDSLTDVSPLQNWNVSNNAEFSNMFGNCVQLYDLSPLKKWNLSEDIFDYLTKVNFNV